MADDASLRRNTPRHIEDAFRPTHDEIARQGLVSALRKHAIVDMKTPSSGEVSRIRSA